MSSQKHNAAEKTQAATAVAGRGAIPPFRLYLGTASRRLLQPLEFDDTEPAIT
jgi:hypothetical protein